MNSLGIRCSAQKILGEKTQMKMNGKRDKRKGKRAKKKGTFSFSSVVAAGWPEMRWTGTREKRRKEEDREIAKKNQLCEGSLNENLIVSSYLKTLLLMEKRFFFHSGERRGRGGVKWSGVVSGNWGGLFYGTEGMRGGRQNKRWVSANVGWM